MKNLPFIQASANFFNSSINFRSSSERFVGRGGGTFGGCETSLFGTDFEVPSPASDVVDFCLSRILDRGTLSLFSSSSFEEEVLEDFDASFESGRSSSNDLLASLGALVTALVDDVDDGFFAFFLFKILKDRKCENKDSKPYFYTINRFFCSVMFVFLFSLGLKVCVRQLANRL